MHEVAFVMHRLLKQILSILNIFQYRAPVDALRRARKNSNRKMLCGAVRRFPAVKNTPQQFVTI